MRMYDLIMKKRNGGQLTKEELTFMVEEYTLGNIPDYQMSAMLMAIYFEGMTDEETAILTECMAHSGDMVDLSAIKGIKVDKHSTGGVGDKTTLIITPIVAACGVKVAKMSGRGLGHTGGTVDKLESIKGFKTSIPEEEFFRIVNKVGVSVIGQTGNLTPADKKLYALRDVTATVESIPLIAASIMSKKLAAGSDCILLDVKTGSGAFMKTVEDSIALAKKMVAIGEHNNRRTVAMITDMDSPLGNYIGNALEVKEAVMTLRGQGPADLTEVCIELAANMLYLANNGTIEECKQQAEEAIQSGRALKKLIELVEAQGGDTSVIEDPDNFEQASIVHEVVAKQDGFVNHIDTEQVGIASMILGAGRETKESIIDYSAGIDMKKKYGDKVVKGDVLGVLYTNKEESVENAERVFEKAYTIGEEKPECKPHIYARVELSKIERY
ncbi:MAG: pyrimidine-nucleoside phosphorylase [bacterium]|nr:pyrimidine-nucleoside phosphorylase [bacterium]